MIRALVFDFDGLILDTETPLIDSYAAIHAKHAVHFDRGAFVRSVGHADYAFDPWHGFSPHADRAALEVARRAIKDELLLEQTLLPGVMALLNEARAKDMPVALASNSPHVWCDLHLKRLGLFDRFHLIACRDDVTLPKPAPDLYKLVLNRFGLRGHEAISFEDSHTGSLAAKRANLWSVAAPNPSTAHHDFSHVDVQVASLAELGLDELMQRFAHPH